MEALEKREQPLFTSPSPLVLHLTEPITETSYSIQAAGMGALTGLTYTIPAHTAGRVSVDLRLPAFTSQDMRNLDAMAMTMLNASEREEVREHEETAASADLSVWSWFFGGGAASASFEETRETMLAKGLTPEQITLLMEAFLEVATNMTRVESVLEVDNRANDYAVSGSFFLWTVSGEIQAQQGTREYRMLANRASAGFPPDDGGAPTTVEYLPIE